MKQRKMLSLLIDQYVEKHKKPPEKIVIHPSAMVVLSMRRSLGPVWNGIPVVCEATKPKDLGDKPATMLGVTLYRDYLQGFDL
jgi:hypothetical protein